MDEMYLRRIIEKQVDRGLFVMLIFNLVFAGWLLDHYTPWSTWWVLLLFIPLIPLHASASITIRDVIFKRRGFHEASYLKLVGVTDGRIGQRAKFLNRFEWVGLFVALPFFVVILFMGGMRGVLVWVIGCAISLLGPWWSDPIQRMILKRRGWDNLYTERVDDD
jgi:hypothetical protein